MVGLVFLTVIVIQYFFLKILLNR